MGSDRRREKLKVLRCRIELQVGGRNEEQVRNKCVWTHSGRPEVYKLTPWCQHSFLKWALFHFKIGFNIKVPVERQMGRWKKNSIPVLNYIVRRPVPEMPTCRGSWKLIQYAVYRSHRGHFSSRTQNTGASDFVARLVPLVPDLTR